MKENMKQEMQCRVLQQELAGENALIQYYQDKEEKNVRFLFINNNGGYIEDEHVASNFNKIAEVTDSETGLTTWYS